MEGCEEYSSGAIAPTALILSPEREECGERDRGHHVGAQRAAAERHEPAGRRAAIDLFRIPSAFRTDHDRCFARRWIVHVTEPEGVGRRGRFDEHETRPRQRQMSKRIYDAGKGPCLENRWNGG